MDQFTKTQQLILKFVKCQFPKDEICVEDIKDINITEFYWYATVHKLGGYIYQKSYEKFAELGTTYKKLGKYFEKCYISNLHKSKVVGKRILPMIIEVLEKNDIKCAVVKGAVNTFALYDTMGERQFNDIDLLISKRDLGKVKELLSSIGIKQKEEKSVQTKYYELVTHQTFPFVYEDESLVEEKIDIDVNFGFAPNNMIGINKQVASILERRIHINVFDKKIPVLSPEDMFIYLLIHIWRDAVIMHKIKATKDIELYQYLEINQLLDRYTMNWSYIDEFVGKNEIQNIIYYTLYHASYITPRILDYCGDLYRKIEPENKEYLSMFGSENKAAKTWNISFDERIFCMDRYSKILETYSKDDFEAYHNREIIFDR